MPTKIRDVYLKVTIAWNGKLLVASSCEASAHAMRYVQIRITIDNMYK